MKAPILEFSLKMGKGKLTSLLFASFRYFPPATVRGEHAKLGEKHTKLGEGEPY